MEDFDVAAMQHYDTPKSTFEEYIGEVL